MGDAWKLADLPDRSTWVTDIQMPDEWLGTGVRVQRNSRTFRSHSGYARNRVK
jgi:hypothetical protein